MTLEILFRLAVAFTSLAAAALGSVACAASVVDVFVLRNVQRGLATLACGAGLLAASCVAQWRLYAALLFCAGVELAYRLLVLARKRGMP